MRAHAACTLLAWGRVTPPYYELLQFYELNAILADERRVPYLCSRVLTCLYLCALFLLSSAWALSQVRGTRCAMRALSQVRGALRLLFMNHWLITLFTKNCELLPP